MKKGLKARRMEAAFDIIPENMSIRLIRATNELILDGLRRSDDIHRLCSPSTEITPQKKKKGNNNKRKMPPFAEAKGTNNEHFTN